MMDWELILEAERRGILPADKAELLAEARKRGLVPGEAQAAEPMAQPSAQPAAEQMPQPEPMQPAAQAAPAAPTDLRAYGMNMSPPVQQQPAQPAPELTYEQTFGIPQTTAPGVIGAVTRGLAPVATGAALGGAVGAMLPIPGAAAIGAGTMAVAPLALDPAVRAFNERFGTNYPTASQAFQDLMTRVGIPVPASSTERAVETGVRAVSSGIAAPAGAARAVQLAVPEASTAARIAEATRVGGMGPTGGGGLTGAAGIGTRAGAAATSGAIGGLATEGTPASAVGGAIGGVAGLGLFSAGKTVLGGLWDATVGRLKPAKAAEDMLYEALGGTPQAGREATEAVSRGQAPGMGVEGMVGTPVTPGYNRTLSEMLIAGGVRPTSEMVQLERELINAGRKVTDQVYKFQTDQVGALRSQLATINDQLRVPMLTPGRLEELTKVRDNLVARVEAEESVLQTAERARIEISDGPQTAGEMLQRRAKLMRAELNRFEVDPRYQKALDAAGSEPNIPVPGVARAVRSIYGDQLSTLMPDSLPDTVKIANRLAKARGDEQPEVSNLATLHNLRKALNKEARDANLAGNLDRGRNIKAILDSINNAIDRSTGLPQEAKRLYGEANAFYRDIYSFRFGRDAGETAKILQPTKYGGNVIDPSETVGKYLANEDASRQFVRTFAGDPLAFSAMRDGIVALAQRQAIPNGVTVSPEGLQKFMAKNAPQIRMFEEAGMNVRGALLAMERRAMEVQDSLKRLQATRGPFENKTPEQILGYIKEDPARMRLAMDRSDEIGKDAIRRVLAEQLNAKLANDPAAALKELTNETTRSAYRVALSGVPGVQRNVIDEFTERARLGVATREAMADPALKRPGAAEAVVVRANLPLPQLQALLKVAQEDIARLRQIDDISRATTGAPTVQARVADQAGGTSIMPNQSMDATSNTLLRVFKNFERRINYKRNAELARIIYGNPGEAITAINNAIRRAEKAAKPARLTRPVPAAAGAVGGQFGEEVRQQSQEPQQ
jgi:hypothetical protein